MLIDGPKDQSAIRIQQSAITQLIGDPEAAWEVLIVDC
jgi:hypothetical protein